MTWPSQPTFQVFDVCEMGLWGETGGWHLSPSYRLNSELRAWKMFFPPPPEMFSHYSLQMLLAGSHTFGLTSQGLMAKGVRHLGQTSVAFHPWWGYDSSQIHLKRHWWHIRSNKNPGGITPTVGMVQRPQGLMSSSWEKYAVILAFSKVAQLDSFSLQ